MWKLLHRNTTVSAPPRSSVGTGGLRAITRLWRSEGRRPRPPVARTTPVYGDPAKVTERIPVELQIPHSQATPQTAPRGRLTTLQSDDYATSLLLLKAQHAELSAERTHIDQVSQQQSEQVADLEARLRFLRRTLDAQPALPHPDRPQPGGREVPAATETPVHFAAAPSSQTPTVPFLRESPPPDPTGSSSPRSTPVLVSVPVPVEAYRSALAAAQHWQAQAQELERQLHTLSQLVRIDSLTGLNNRRSFDEHLPRSVARSQRVGDSVCLLMIDIDHFKGLNDAHGHPAGDAVLRSVASSIACCTRPSDHVARYGGEEFAVVLSDIDSAQAVAVAERIRRQVAFADHCPHKVTVSIGVAEYRPARGGGHDDLLAEADRALYIAKHSGRNRVAAAPSCGLEDPPGPTQSKPLG